MTVYNQLTRNILAEEISNTINKKPQINMIVIDGPPGSGKSKLSYCLGCQLQIRVINLDDFMFGDKNTFWESIKFDILRYKLISILDKKRLFIFEGILASKVLEHCIEDITSINILKIYCKRSSSYESSYPDKNQEIRDYEIDYSPENNANYRYQLISYSSGPFNRVESKCELIKLEQINE